MDKAIMAINVIISGLLKAVFFKNKKSLNVLYCVFTVHYSDLLKNIQAKIPTYMHTNICRSWTFKSIFTAIYKILA